jgi:hypothetical protein
MSCDESIPTAMPCERMKGPATALRAGLTGCAGGQLQQRRGGEEEAELQRRLGFKIALSHPRVKLSSDSATVVLQTKYFQGKHPGDPSHSTNGFLHNHTHAKMQMLLLAVNCIPFHKANEVLFAQTAGWRASWRAPPDPDRDGKPLSRQWAIQSLPPRRTK